MTTQTKHPLRKINGYDYDYRGFSVVVYRDYSFNGTRLIRSSYFCKELGVYEHTMQEFKKWADFSINQLAGV